MLLLPIPMLPMDTLVFMLMLRQPSMDMLDTSMASVRLTLMLVPTPLDRSLLDSLSTTPMLLDTPTMLVLSPEPPTPPLSTTDTLPMLLLPIPMLPMDTLVFMLMLPQPSMDTLDTSMASVRLSLMLMPTPLDRSLLDSLSTTPMLLDIPTMLVLSPEPPTLLQSTTDTLPMLLLHMLDMLDILAMLVWDMLVLAILVLTTDKHIQ